MLRKLLKSMFQSEVDLWHLRARVATGDNRRGFTVGEFVPADRDARELALWREEARLAQQEGAHPYAKAVAAKMQARVQLRLVGSDNA